MRPYTYEDRLWCVDGTQLVRGACNKTICQISGWRSGLKLLMLILENGNVLRAFTSFVLTNAVKLGFRGAYKYETLSNINNNRSGSSRKKVENGICDSTATTSSFVCHLHCDLQEFIRDVCVLCVSLAHSVRVPSYIRCQPVSRAVSQDLVNIKFCMNWEWCVKDGRKKNHVNICYEKLKRGTQSLTDAH